jgi:phosphatidate cytidylyltransferase
MKQRLIVAAIGIPLTAAAIWLLPGLWFSILMMCVAAWCISEAMHSAGKLKFNRKPLLMYVLIAAGFICLILLRDRYGVPLTFFVVGCAYIGDAGAMLTGKFIGKHVGGSHPFPKISPNKTVAGAVGGLVVPMLFSLAFGKTLGWITAVVCGFVLGLTAECGDLFFSFVKRKLGVKDFGTILPGHGGLLDRFDSMVFVAPVALGLFHLILKQWQ